MARFYANENFPLGVVEELRRMGHDAHQTAQGSLLGLDHAHEPLQGAQERLHQAIEKPFLGGAPHLVQLDWA
jgi:hypothetical protein